MAFPKCYLLSIYMANIHSKKIKTKLFSLVRIKMNGEVQCSLGHRITYSATLCRKLVTIFIQKYTTLNYSQNSPQYKKRNNVHALFYHNQSAVSHFRRSVHTILQE